MKETSCGAVLYTMRGNTPHYCIVQTNRGHVSFPKGHMDPGETEQETAIREIYEETGLRVQEFHPDFREIYSYTSRKGLPKDVVFFLARYEGQTITRQEEELTAHWEVPFEEALALVNTEREQEILKKADAVIAGL